MNLRKEPIGLPVRSLAPYINDEKSLTAKPAIIEFVKDWYEGTNYRERIIVDGDYKLAIFPIAGGRLLYNLYDNPEYIKMRCRLTEKLLLELVKSDRLDGKRICGA